MGPFAAALRRTRLELLSAAALGGLLGLAVAVKPLLVAVVAAAVGCVALVVYRADLALLLMIAALPWENKLHYPNATLSTDKGIGVLVMFGYLLQVLLRRRRELRLGAIHAAVGFLAVWILVSLTFSPEPSEGFRKVVRWLILMAMFFLITQLLERRAELVRAVRWFVASVIGASFYGLVQFITEHHHFRVAGPLADPNEFAYLLTCALPLCAYLVVRERRRRALWVVGFVLIAAATLGTFSRGALVGIGAVVAWGIFTRRVPLWAVTSGVLAAGVIVILGFTVWAPLVKIALNQKSHIAASNAEAREVYWGAALKLAERRPLTGVGPGRYPREAAPLIKSSPVALKEPVTHNTYLQILAENGVPALLLFLSYLAASWWQTAGAERRARGDGDRDALRLAIALRCSLIVATISGIFLSVELAPPFWLIGAFAFSLGALSSGQAGARRAPLLDAPR